MPGGMTTLSDPKIFAHELIAAGFRDPDIAEVTIAYTLEVAALTEPDTLFGMSPDWANLSDVEKAVVIDEVRRMSGNRPSLPIPSTALIAVAQR